MSKKDQQAAKSRAPIRSAKLQKYSAPALEKGLEILEYLSEQVNANSMLQIAEGVGRSKNEIFRMMIVLEESGYVERQDADSFILSDKLYQLGLRRPGNKRLTDVALPMMEEFCELLPFCCYLSVASGEQSVVIAQAQSAVPLGLAVSIGHRLPLSQSAEGICLMAFMSTARRSQVTQRLALSKDSSAQLLSDINSCKTQGDMSKPDGMIPGVEHIALPIFNSIGDSAAAAIAVPYIKLNKHPHSLSSVRAQLRILAKNINKSYSHK